MIGTVELVLFGIESAVKLARTGRTIYVEDTKARDIVLPLPAAFDDLLARSFKYAEVLKAKDRPRYDAVYRTHVDQAFGGGGEQGLRARQQVTQLYLLDVAKGRVPTARLSSGSLAGLTAVGQWRDGEEPFPHPLQRVAGVLVEIAVDYFVHVPGTLDETSSWGKTLKALLTGLDDFEFQDARWDSIVIELFTASLDALKDNPDLAVSDEEGQEILSGIVTGVADRLRAEIAKLPPTGDLDAERRIGRAGQMVLRSVLRASGEYVLDHPDALGLGRDAKSPVIRSVGNAFLDLLFEDTGAGGAFGVGDALRRTISTEGGDRLVRTFLETAVENPEFFGIGNLNVRTWVVNVLRGLHDGHPEGKTFFDESLFSDVAYLVVDHGLRDLPALLKFDSQGKAIAVEVARQVFDVMTDPPTAAGHTRWRFKLGREDVLEVFRGTLAAMAEHPEWLFARPANQKAAAASLRFAVEILSATGEASFKTLLRGGQIEEVLAAVLGSGILTELDGRSAKQIASVVTKVATSVTAEGLTGLDRVLDADVLNDLLGALARSGLLDRVFDGGPADKKKLVAGIADLARRQGVEELTIPELIDQLASKVA